MISPTRGSLRSRNSHTSATSTPAGAISVIRLHSIMVGPGESEGKAPAPRMADDGSAFHADGIEEVTYRRDNRICAERA